MPLQKQSVNIDFSQGLETKTDPFQIPIGKFARLQNSVFTTGRRLQKRNGYALLSALPDSSSFYLTTFSGNLTALGTTIQAYNSGSKTWVSKGDRLSVDLDVLPLVRTNTNQSQADSVVAPNGLVCTVYTDQIPSGGSTTNVYKYVIADSVTGQNIVAPTAIPVSSGAITNAPRVFLLGNYFVIVFTNLITATNHLQYVAISTINTSSVTANTDISALYTPSTKLAFDGFVVNNSLYLAWNGSDVGGAIRMTYIDAQLNQHGTKVFTGRTAEIMSVCADSTGTTPVVYAAFYESSGPTGYVLAVNQQLDTILSPTQWLSSGSIKNVTSSAKSGVCTIFYEVVNAYTYDGTIATDYINKKTVTQAGTVSSASTVVRSVGLASKSFIVNGVIYALTVYSSPNQSSYFLIDSSGNVVAKLAYSNGDGYKATGLPNVTITDNVVQIAYLIKDQVQPVNKTQGVSSSGAVYAQLGVNLVDFTIGTNSTTSSEIGQNLNISGGFLWGYDGYQAVENGFFLWPDSVKVTTATGSGSITAQQYYYVATYEWSDNQGNLYRSAPSIPVSITTSTPSSTNTIYVPTLRLTHKTANPVKIVLYRWSAAQQTYYQATSILVPVLNDTTVDYVTITDTQADSSIIGNNILYTTGGVVENIGGPPTSNVTLYRSRLFAIDSENRNLLWYSKQVLEATPVEMSDLFTIFVAPTTGAEDSTGTMRAISAMDDKLVIFKRDAIYYLTGNGPDATGANNDFSEPVFITSTVGCANQQSIVFIPQGLMFQSDKGIWLLGRDLSTTYIGAPVEAFNSFTVLSAVNVPNANQVRFTLDNGMTLMYDYYYNQWGTFTGVSAVASTIYQNLHTYINSYGQAYQENPGSYLDGAKPVLMSFTTGWLNPAGLQGFIRAYKFYFLGTYISPHKLTVSVGYDYGPGPSQQVVVSPDNYSGTYGTDPLYGDSSAYGGVSQLENWEINLVQQKCKAFQISIDETYDPSLGAAAGAGLTLSGLNLVVGVKATYPRIRDAHSTG